MTKNHNSPVSNIEAVVMRRVRSMYIMRTFFTPTILSTIFLLLAVWGIGREVWVSHVFQNMPPLVHVDAAVRFFEMAFLNTRFAVQLLVLAVFTAVAWLGYNLSQALRYSLKLA